jgi:hypothetical protein
MDESDKFISVETKKYQDTADETNVTDFKSISKPIGINDIIEVTNEENKLNTCKFNFYKKYSLFDFILSIYHSL